MKLKKEQIIAIVIVLAVTGLFILLVHLPQRRSLSALNEEFENQDTKIQQARQEYETLSTLNKQVGELRSVMSRVSKKMPDQNELGPSLQKLVVGLNTQKLLTQEIMPQSPRVGDRYSEMPVNITCKGDFANICRFLAGVENSQNIIRIEDIQLESNLGRSSAVKAKIILSICCSRS